MMRLLLLLVLLLLALSPCAVAAPHKEHKKRPKLKTAVRATPHPSGGRGYAYSHDFRLAAMRLFDTGQHRNPIIQDLRARRLFPVPRTLRRYHRRRALLGHLRRFRRTGNRRARVLRGLDLMMLAHYRILFPKARASEINVWLYHATGRYCFYTPSQIQKLRTGSGFQGSKDRRQPAKQTIHGTSSSVGTTGHSHTLMAW